MIICNTYLQSVLQTSANESQHPSQARTYYYPKFTTTAELQRENLNCLWLGRGLYPFSSIQTTSLQQIYQIQRLKHSPVCYLQEKLIQRKKTVKSILIRTMCSALFILFKIESFLFYHFEMTWPFRRNKCFMLCDRKFKSSKLE